LSLKWIHESTPCWDREKERIVGAAGPGTFSARFDTYRRGDLLPGEWWRVERDGQIVGYGWLDVSWGDAELLLATAPDARRKGVGSFILEQLANEANLLGVNYLYNVLSPIHPDHDRVAGWLRRRGFEPIDGGRMLRTIARRSRPPVVNAPRAE
jgi:N-acetylglutamate synthase-like GNAT family acetyltransferase